MDNDQAHGAELPRSGFRTVPGTRIRGYYFHTPSAVTCETPVIVSVHGVSRNAAEHMFRLRPMAERCGAAIVAPYFPAADYRGYQQLLCRNGERADLALLDMIDDFSRATGIDTGRFLLAGFSGGGQFVHRFAMFHADRVERCIAIAAGWYTWPDEDRPYPLGVGLDGFSGHLQLHPQWRDVPIHLLVGSRDDGPEVNLNSDPAIVALQGHGRHQRACRWSRAMQRYRNRTGGAPVTLETIAHFGHDFGKAVERHGLDQRLAEILGLAPAEEALCA